MNHYTPAHEAKFELLCRLSRNSIDDSVLGEGERQGRFRQFFVILNADILHQDDLPADKVEFYESLFQLVAGDLRIGFDLPARSLEVFDHQARYWLATQVERFYQGEHHWCQQLKDNPEWVAALSFGYGAVPAVGGKEYGLLPFCQVQLTRYEGEEGIVVAVEQWTLEKNGLNPDPTLLTQFGRPDPEEGG